MKKKDLLIEIEKLQSKVGAMEERIRMLEYRSTPAVPYITPTVPNPFEPITPHPWPGPYVAEPNPLLRPPIWAGDPIPCGPSTTCKTNNDPY